jgi:hypothetical protein
MNSTVELIGDILFIRLVGLIDNKEALDIDMSLRESFRKEARPLVLFIDLRNATDIVDRARQVLADTIRTDTPLVKRTAVLYDDPTIGARAKIIYRMGKRGKVDYFTDEEKAMAWLLERTR